MSSPTQPLPNETPEQRQARLDGAYRKQAEVDAEKRAYLAAEGRMEAPPVGKLMPSPFAITPVVADAPGIFPFRHYLQRLAVSRASTPVMPELEVQGVRPEMLPLPQRPVPMVGNGDFRPTAAQLAEYNAGRIKGHWNSDTGVFENPFVPPPTDAREVIGYQGFAPGVRSGDTRIFADQPPVPSASDYIADMALPMVSPPMSPTMLGKAPPMVSPPIMGPIEGPLNIEDYPSRGVIDNRIGPNFGKPMQPKVRPSLGDMLRGSIMQPTPMQPSMNTQPTFDREFNALREKYGDEGLQSAVREYYRGGSVMRYR
jgi:hypothetical protein